MNCWLICLIVAVSFANQALTAAVPDSSNEPKAVSTEGIKKVFDELDKNFAPLVKNIKNESEAQISTFLNRLHELSEAHSDILSDSTKTSLQNVVNNIKNTGVEATKSITSSKTFNDVNSLFTSISNDLSAVIEKHKDVIPNNAAKIAETMQKYVNDLTSQKKQ